MQESVVHASLLSSQALQFESAVLILKSGTVLFAVTSRRTRLAFESCVGVGPSKYNIQVQIRYTLNSDILHIIRNSRHKIISIYYNVIISTTYRWEGFPSKFQFHMDGGHFRESQESTGSVWCNSGKFP